VLRWFAIRHSMQLEMIDTDKAFSVRSCSLGRKAGVRLLAGIPEVQVSVKDTSLLSMH
jgi:hypothetical protein